MNFFATNNCLICRQPVVGPNCPHCGANSVTVWETIRSAKPPTIPNFWRMMFRGTHVAFSPATETIWAGLKPEFKSSTLEKYAYLSRHARTRTTLVMVPLVVALNAACFMVGVGVANFLGHSGDKSTQWLFGIGAIPVLFLVIVLPVGSFAERILHRSPTERAADEFIQQFDFIGVAVMERTPLPWYLNSDVWFPLVNATIMLLGWLLL